MPSTLSPYISVKDASAAIDFYVSALGATEDLRLVDPGDGRIGHAELTIGDASFMLSDEYPDFGAVSPDTLGGSPVKLHVYVDDVDAVFAKAVSLGATELRPVKDEFFGDRTGSFADPFGHVWMVATKTEDVSAEEMQARWSKAFDA